MKLRVVFTQRRVDISVGVGSTDGKSVVCAVCVSETGLIVFLVTEMREVDFGLEGDDAMVPVSAAVGTFEWSREVVCDLDVL